MELRPLIFSFCFLTIISANPASELCNSHDAQQSCGQCIKAHVDCAWCIDPHSSLTNRCQPKSEFSNATCTSHLIYSPQTAQKKILQNLLLESKQQDGKTLVRLQPQAVSVKLMPSHKATIDFKYLHQSDPQRKPAGPETMEIQTSDVRDSPLKLKFFIVCDGELKETKSCRVQHNQIVEFKIEVHVESCSSTGDITLSVGILGQRTIAGLYVTTICGCECEKHPEINSRLCHQNGHLVCGQCICDKSHGGDKCECPLETYGVSSAAELENQCRFNSSSAVCNASGKCKCGQCQCNKPTLSGKFCECDNDSCPSVNGKICSGNGVCDCGVCKCETGWERDDCSCSTESNNCVDDGTMCSNNGRCECNRCVCYMGKTGAFCGTDEKTEPPKKQLEKPEDVETNTDAPPGTDLPSDDELEKALDDQDPTKPDEQSSSSSGLLRMSMIPILLLFAF